MSISEQVKELEEAAAVYGDEDRYLLNILLQAATTIETLKWIPCSERMPEEYDSIFTKFKGTDKWNSSMFEKTSNRVNVTVESEKGERATMTAYTIDGKWKLDSFMKFKVIAWKPFPEPYQGNT